ncbi:MAG: helix-turn-helix domain-containing protein [Deltaproteobacteria bacterium]|nr:helix-turn-helix domain-containing protein [Deltaproteobacteria bacterium]
MNLSEYYTINEVANYFGLSRSPIVDAISRGYFDVHFFDGQKMMFHENQIEKMKDRWSASKKKIRRRPLKPGLYYSVKQTAIILRVGEGVIRDAMRNKRIKVSHIDDRQSVIHQDEVKRFGMIRRASTAHAKREAQDELSRLGFTYSRNPPAGKPRGNSGNPSPYRRGWSKDGVYYGLTAVEALSEWRRKGIKSAPHRPLPHNGM